MSSESPKLLVGHCINGRYNLTDFLGRGKDGQVYRAHDEHLDMEVAIKLIEPQAGQVATWDEAQRLVQLQSDFLLRVYNADIVHNSDVRFITTPVMEGGDLHVSTYENWADTRRASSWGQQIARGLDRVHAAHLLHRDVKPGNVYLDSSGEVKLGDLGMAAQWDSSGRTRPAGTLATAAPEALQEPGGYCSVQSDIYSLAATVYYLLSGEYPVDHKLSDRQLRRCVLDGELRDLKDLAPQVPLSITKIVMGSLSRDPTARAQSAHDFANRLASATSYTRNWKRIPTHQGHFFCLLSDSKKKLQPVQICVTRNGKTFDIVTSHINGRRISNCTLTGVAHTSLPRSLRKIVKSLG